MHDNGLGGESCRYRAQLRLRRPVPLQSTISPCRGRNPKSVAPVFGKDDRRPRQGGAGGGTCSAPSNRTSTFGECQRSRLIGDLQGAILSSSGSARSADLGNNASAATTRPGARRIDPNVPNCLGRIQWREKATRDPDHHPGRSNVRLNFLGAETCLGLDRPQWIDSGWMLHILSGEPSSEPVQPCRLPFPANGKAGPSCGRNSIALG